MVKPRPDGRCWRKVTERGAASLSVLFLATRLCHGALLTLQTLGVCQPGLRISSPSSTVVSKETEHEDGIGRRDIRRSASASTRFEPSTYTCSSTRKMHELSTKPSKCIGVCIVTRQESHIKNGQFSLDNPTTARSCSLIKHCKISTMPVIIETDVHLIPNTRKREMCYRFCPACTNGFRTNHER